jgi:hypothetical protein
MDSTSLEIYNRPYSLLPNLKKIQDSEVFLPCDNLPEMRYEKQRSLARQQCNCTLGYLPDKLWTGVHAYIQRNHTVDLSAFTSLHGVAVNIPEDLCIHKVNGQFDYLMAAHVCFPGGWNPWHTLGKSFDKIHGVIPGIDLRASRKQVELMVSKGPFERFVWGVIYDDELNRHSDRTDLREFRPEAPFFKIRIERQVTVPFPEHSCCLFVLRHYFVGMAEIDKGALLATLMTMTEEQHEYKGITERFIGYLREDSHKSTTD